MGKIGKGVWNWGPSESLFDNDYVSDLYTKTIIDQLYSINGALIKIEDK